MYLDYWQLEAKPFESYCEDSFLFAAPSRQAALHKLRYAIENHRGAAVLAGPAGGGKTLLVDSLEEELGANCQPFVRVVFPQMSERDLLAYLAERLGRAPPGDPPRLSIEESLRRLEFVLRDIAGRKRQAVIVVDEAHLLEDSGLVESLRLLLNLTVDGRQAFTLLLVGQASVLPMVARHGAFDERLDIKVVLPALTAEETANYIQHRLDAAGASRDIFSSAALETVHQLAGGAPRRINRLCDLALLVGFANGDQQIDAEDLHAVHDELVVAAPLAA